jgi:hypothetical protein
LKDNTFLLEVRDMSPSKEPKTDVLECKVGGRDFSGGRNVGIERYVSDKDLPLLKDLSSSYGAVKLIEVMDVSSCELDVCIN